MPDGPQGRELPVTVQRAEKAGEFPAQGGEVDAGAELGLQLVQDPPGDGEVLLRGPEHSVDREQVWTVTAGTVRVTSAGRTEEIAAGRTLVLPPHVLRRVHAVEAAEAHVAMRSDALVTVPGEEEPRVLPWAR